MARRTRHLLRAAHNRPDWPRSCAQPKTVHADRLRAQGRGDGTAGRRHQHGARGRDRPQGGPARDWIDAHPINQLEGVSLKHPTGAIPARGKRGVPHIPAQGRGGHRSSRVCAHPMGPPNLCTLRPVSQSNQACADAPPGGLHCHGCWPHGACPRRCVLQGTSAGRPCSDLRPSAGRVCLPPPLTARSSKETRSSPAHSRRGVGTLPRHHAYLHQRTTGRIGSLTRLIRQAAITAITAITNGTEKSPNRLPRYNSTTSPNNSTAPSLPFPDEG
ncbi:hypothetical protein SUDANB105_07696 [Streptomyces sp. enrichment culture]